MLGSIIGAVGSLVGGLIGSKDKDKALQIQQQMNAENIALQKEFAQSGIQWKAEDAKKAGIHPLYAMGANTHSFSPVSVGVDSSSPMGSAVSAMGQDIGRAINSTRSTTDQQKAFDSTVQGLTVEKMGLENQLLASQIAKLRAAPSPGIPVPAATNIVDGQNFPIPKSDKFTERPRLQLGNGEIITDPSYSNANDAEDRYGEIGGNLAGLYTMWADMKKNGYGIQFEKTPDYGWEPPVPRWLNPRTHFRYYGKQK